MTPPDPTRLEAIRRQRWVCTRTPTAPCRERDGVQHPQYATLAVREWCDDCVVTWLLATLQAQAATIARLEWERDALQEALDEGDRLTER